MTHLVKRVSWSLAHRGVGGTVRSAWMSLERRLRKPSVLVHPFDVAYGTDTGGLIPGAGVGVGHRHDLFIAGYAGVPPSGFRAAMARWQGLGLRHRLEGYTFVDLGCGK